MTVNIQALLERAVANEVRIAVALAIAELQAKLALAQAKEAELREQIAVRNAALLKCADILDANDFGHDIRFEARALSDRPVDGDGNG